MRAVIVGFVCATLVTAQARFPMKDRKVGALDTDYDKRKSADFGFAHVFSDEDNLRVEGPDHAGKLWRIWIPKAGIGGVDVWTADLDHDGQQDLLIRSLSSKVGRCVNEGTITVVLFDDSGRPVPWIMTAQVPDWNKAPVRGAFVLDANRDGRAEVVVTSCEGTLKGGEERRVSGVYEAQRARMVPIRAADPASYLRAAKLVFGFRQVTWLPTTPEEWPDQTRGLDSAPSLHIEALVKGDEKHRGVDFPIVNGRIEDPVKGPLEQLSHNHMLYSDGVTRLGWPYVVIDGPDGRGVYIANNEDALRRIIKAGYHVKILGDPSQPTWIWATIN